ncbi:amino acid ABC transporter substrate-binding protein, PAAT family [Oceanospirillum multiglobuliferum]|uniref:Amino acid ABC transporter substrate-binding protein n=1 Tax=Oceanospirillum multiglobuliferum TaxID=64969 RepID=A0A1T4R4N0_9GAMM|nr:transporter substrate-binding domain-containing protein [Oceanospirillum multiglobuliferum]OPX55241.1 amino acid ABC transporter substrate-binding protein [Oceanospirillum multiglobuliferum]SKA10827.1 amino acid ABC transporter substrate-binding protein, PAAT family [Oceanospirillum multiglobuliferum]
MKKRNKLFSILTMIALPSLASANSAALWESSTLSKVIESNELRVCFEAGYMPFEMKAKNGSYMGFDIDIAKELAKSMGVKHVPVNTAWDGIIPALLTNKCDILIGGMTVTSQRNLKVNFADPYIVVGQSLLIKPSLKGVVTSYADLNDPKYVIAAKLGTSGEIAAKKLIGKATIRLFESEAEGALEVANGNADALVYDFPSNAIFSSQNKDRVIHLDKPFTYEPLGWAIRKGDPDFLNYLNNFLRQIKGDGRYMEMYKKWFANDAWLKKVQ